MIAACQQTGVKLMVAYRSQYKPHTRAVQKMVRDNQYGKPRYSQAQNSQSSANPHHWRYKKALAGGGALPDIGLYCLHTARFLLGTEPMEVFTYTYSTPGNPLFQEIEEVVSFQLRFPDGVIVDNVADYNAHNSVFYRVSTERG
jgi:predicted dehydrogenase